MRTVASSTLIVCLALAGSVFHFCCAEEEAKAPATSLVVHEWGTFTSFVGSDGVQRPFAISFDDLPKFVYHTLIHSDTEPLMTKGGYMSHNYVHFKRGSVSMETPVLYFYSKESLDVSVSLPNAKFAITESFPNVEDWNHVELLVDNPGVALPTDADPNNHYFAARETDAVPLRVKKGEGYDTEKFLFYRGVGSVTQPLTVKALGEGHFALSNTAPARIGSAFLVVSSGGKLSFARAGSIAAGETVPVDAPPQTSAQQALTEALREALVADGLFDKEARAMVKTWEHAWLGEEGTRVLYVLPRVVTDDWLPLELAPSPAALQRTMLGRIDVLTPENEREMESVAKGLDEGAAAQKKLTRFGRFGDSALQAARERMAK